MQPWCSGVVIQVVQAPGPSLRRPEVATEKISPCNGLGCCPVRVVDAWAKCLARLGQEVVQNVPFGWVWCDPQKLPKHPPIYPVLEGYGEGVVLDE